jgi:hypothetical protein
MHGYQHTDLYLPLEDSPALLDKHGPIFVLGCPRSGTTFLSHCLGSLEQIEEFVGVLAPPRLMHSIGCRSAQGETVSVENMLRIMRDVFWQSFWRRRYFLPERMIQVLSGKKRASNLLSKPSLEGAYFCYKEPFMCLAATEVARHFPNSKFIHILRDGRDSADSLERTYPDALTDRVLTNKRLANNKNSEIGIIRPYRDFFLPWWVPAGREDDFVRRSAYGRCVWMWNEMVSRTIACGHSLGMERYIEVRYEEVVSQPLKQAQRLLDFRGLPMSKRLRRRFDRARTESIGVARNRQCPERLDEAKAVAGDLLRHLGYVT